MSLAILGLGTAVPGTAINQADALQVARALCCRTEEQVSWLPAIFGHTGIEQRHMALEAEVLRDMLEGTTHSGHFCLPTGEAEDRGPTTGQRMRHYAEHAAPLALRASRQALDRAGLAARDISHLVTVSCTGFSAPGVDIRLIKGLEMSPTVERTNVGFMGCHGALNGLRVARAFTGAEPDARVLLCAIELCIVHYHYGWNPQKVIANALFADGAAALVGVPCAAAPAGAWTTTASGSCLIPDSEDAMGWTIGDHGFEMTLAKQIPRLIARHLRPWMASWLAGEGLSPATVASWAVHPGGPAILDAVEEALGLGREATEASREVLARCGNMSSPTVLFILDHLRARQAPRPCVALAFGPGLIAEAALFR